MCSWDWNQLSPWFQIRQVQSAPYMIPEKVLGFEINRMSDITHISTQSSVWSTITHQYRLFLLTKLTGGCWLDAHFPLFCHRTAWWTFCSSGGTASLSSCLCADRCWHQVSRPISQPLPWHLTNSTECTGTTWMLRSRLWWVRPYLWWCLIVICPSLYPTDPSGLDLLWPLHLYLPWHSFLFREWPHKWVLKGVTALVDVLLWTALNK